MSETQRNLATRINEYRICLDSKSTDISTENSNQAMNFEYPAVLDRSNRDTKFQYI